MWDKILKYLNDNKDALGWLFGSGVVLAVLGGIYRFIVWVFKESRLRKIRTNDNFPFKMIPPNSNVAKEILGGADDDPLADRNIPYQQRIQGRNTRRELEELIEDNRWILITGRTGLGKTREAVHLAQSLNNEGWTILCLTREAWLDAPAKLPNNVPERKLLFFLDDLNKKCLSSKAEIRPDASESLTLPIYEPFQTRLQRTLEAFDTFCGKSEIRVIATARNERTSEFDEPTEWDKLGWVKYDNLWERFKLIDLPEPDKTTEQTLLKATASNANVHIDSIELLIIAKRNDGTFRNLVENISSAKIEGAALSSENFRDTLKGTWQKRYQKAVQKHQEAKEIYDAIEVLKNIGIAIDFWVVLRVSGIIAGEHMLKLMEHRWRCFFILRQLIKTENILHPRDGQIEGKGYKVKIEDYLAKLYFEIGRDFYSTANILRKYLAFYAIIFITPKSLFEDRQISPLKRIYGTLISAGAVLNNVGYAYNYFGLFSHALLLFRNSLELKKWDIGALFDREYKASSWSGLGNSYSQLNQYNESASAYKKAIEFSPRYGPPWIGLGDAYVGLEQYDEAIKAFQKAIEIDPKEALPWIGLGNAYVELEQYDEAIKAFQKAIEIDPKDALPWIGLGNAYVELEQYDEAIKVLQKAIEINPEVAISYYILGSIYTKVRDFHDAFSVYQKAVEISPEDGMYSSSLVSVMRKLGREDEAKVQEQITRPLMDKENEYNRACFESICGNKEEALSLLKIALEQEQARLEWAQKDPDFDFIRDDTRFKELVGLE